MTVVEHMEGTGSPIKVFLLDDHEIVRRGVRDLLEADGSVHVVGEAGSAAEALVRVPACRPDVAVLDVRLPDGDGIQVCRELRAADPSLRCLMLTSFSDDEALVDAIMAGAAGYVLKQVRGGELLDAIHAVARGQSMLDHRSAAQLLSRMRERAEAKDPLAALTPQERRILMLIGEGRTNREIGQELFLSEKTVKNYVTSLLSKLGMSRRTQAAVYVTNLNAEGRR